MVELARASHGRKPSAAPRWFSGKMWTANAFCVPSGCGIAETPIYEPSLICDSSVLTTANTATLSVMLTFTSLPSRVLMLKVGPSTASMVPRMRTGGACCAQATVVRTDSAASAAVIQDVSFGMALPFGFLRPTLGNPGDRGVFLQLCRPGQAKRDPGPIPI